MNDPTHDLACTAQVADILHQHDIADADRLAAELVRLVLEAQAPEWYHRSVAVVCDERDRLAARSRPSRPAGTHPAYPDAVAAQVPSSGWAVYVDIGSLPPARHAARIADPAERTRLVQLVLQAAERVGAGLRPRDEPATLTPAGGVS